MLSCCKECAKYYNCEKKWLRGERGESPFCCRECGFYKSCHEYIRRGKGLDIGTAFVKSIQKIEEVIIGRSIRNAFFEVEHTNFVRKMLDNSKVKYILKEDKLHILGDESMEFANMFGRETRRPLRSGVISPTEKEALPMVELLIKNILGEPFYQGEIVYCSIPANPIDADFNIVYHEKILNGFLKGLGYRPKFINEGEAVILSELVDEDFTGIGISFGGGMVNVCLSFKSISVVKFSLTKAGDWINQQVARALNVTESRVSAIKETTLDLNKKEGITKIEQALSIYYNHLIEYVIENMKHEFSKQKVRLPLDEPISIVLSGGTSLPNGFIERFKRILESVKLPVLIGNVKMALYPLRSVARGAFVAASADESNNN